jgi:hypothetical protein
MPLPVLFLIIGLAMFAVYQSVRIWRDPRYFEKTVSLFQYHPAGVEMNRDVQRGCVPAAFGMAVLALLIGFAVWSDPAVVGGSRDLSRAFTATCLTLFLLGFALQYSIAWFGRPRFLIPPHLRHERARWQRRGDVDPAGRPATTPVQASRPPLPHPCGRSFDGGIVGATGKVSAERLSGALVVWTGFGELVSPVPSEDAVVARYGMDAASDMMPAIRALADCFYASEAHLVARDPGEMAAIARLDFRRRHPEIGEKAVRALSWCYTFDHK